MQYKINFEQYASHFALPCEIVNDELAGLDALYLKTALLIFKNADKHYSVNLLSNLLGEREERIEEAVFYWIRRGVLIEAERSAQTGGVPVLSGRSASMSSQPRKDTPPELSYLLECTETLIGRTISPAEYKTIIHILEYLKMPADVILMAIDYCFTAGKMNARYLEKVCAAWTDNGIVTHELAEEYLTFLKQERSNETAVKKLLGIENRALSEKERSFVRKWFEEYHFSLEMISAAYERMIKWIGKLSFPYMDKILSSWHEQGFTNADETKAEKRTQNMEQGDAATYDLNEIERFWDQVPQLKERKD